jgi:hypothetical protein
MAVYECWRGDACGAVNARVRETEPERPGCARSVAGTEVSAPLVNHQAVDVGLHDIEPVAPLKSTLNGSLLSF